MGRGIRRARRATARHTIAPGLGARIRLARERARLSQTQAGSPRYPATYLSAIEHGRHLPSLEALTLIAGNLGLTAAELITGESEPVDPVTALSRALESVRRAREESGVQQSDALVAAEFLLQSLLQAMTRS